MSIKENEVRLGELEVWSQVLVTEGNQKVDEDYHL